MYCNSHDMVVKMNKQKSNIKEIYDKNGKLLNKTNVKFEPFLFNANLFYYNEIPYLLEISEYKNKIVYNYKCLSKIKEIIENGFKDKLTGFYTKNYFQEYIDSLCKEEKKFSLIMADVDNFKKINSDYGHFVADEKLKACGDIFRDVLQADGIVFRTGGDEFVVVSRLTNRECQQQLFNKINARLNKEQCISCSFGCIKYDYTKTTAENLNILDDILYESKNKGKSIITFGGKK